MMFKELISARLLRERFYFHALMFGGKGQGNMLQLGER